MVLIRYILIGLVIYLIVRSVTIYSKAGESQQRKPDIKDGSKSTNKKISKEIGDYVDYEEVKKRPG